MRTTLTLIRYPGRWMGLIALFSMALFHIPLFLHRGISFYKLLGTGKRGSFDKHPDWQQWGILAVHRDPELQLGADPIRRLYGGFIAGWCRILGCETYTLLLEPLEGHGRWDGREPFGTGSASRAYAGPVAILTRATIRLSKAGRFWAHVEAVAEEMAAAEGYVFSVGIGEAPLLKQATFSVWRNSECMRNFAYKNERHADVIRKTRKENWYSEDLFMRFKPLQAAGSWRGTHPLEGIA